MSGLIGFCVLLWFFGQPAPKAQPDIPTSSTELMAQIESVSDRFVDASEMTPPAPSPSDKKPKNEILVFVSANCPPCDRWKRCEMQRFMDAGWSVGIVEQHSYPLTPHFLIDANNKQTEHRGYLPFEKISEVVK